MTVEVHLGDSRDVLKTLADCSVDSVVTDPPYALVSIGKRFGAEGAAPAKAGKTGAYQRASAGFMGKKWDTGETAFAVEFWAEVLRVLKPGGHVIAFGGTRSFHRLACAIEDGGFEIRDQLAWLYGSGFPKSHDVAKGPATPDGERWQGWGTALKPALEPICLARKPLIGTVAANVLAHGTGALNIDGCRIETGRWPANLIHDGSDEVLAAFPAEAGGGGGSRAPGRTGKPTISAPGVGLGTSTVGHDDSGSAARFFYSAKADAEDRLGSKHPTVKPVDLMAWLVRLVTPPGGVVLDPFAGTGTTGLAAMGGGFSAILIEREPEYHADIQRRLAWARGEGRLTIQELNRNRKPTPVPPLLAALDDPEDNQ